MGWPYHTTVALEGILGMVLFPSSSLYARYVILSRPLLLSPDDDAYSQEAVYEQLLCLQHITYVVLFPSRAKTLLCISFYQGEELDMLTSSSV